MFYIFSKILGVFLNPIIWIFALLIVAFISKKKTQRKKMFLAAIVLLFVFSNSFILNEILLKWEPTSLKNEQIKESYDYGIVLSGMLWYDNESERINFMQSSDRIWQAVRLYHEGKIKKILITGGKAAFFEKDTIESAVLKGFLIKIGIPHEDILTEKLSRNTHENALYTARLLKSLPHDKLLLITSASHMRRAKSCFTKVGLECDIFPTDHYSGTRKFDVVTLFVPNAQILFQWNAFIHELLGIISYKISGYI